VLKHSGYVCLNGVGCALAAQLLAREQTWRDEHATYIGANNDLARFHPVSHAAGYVSGMRARPLAYYAAEMERGRRPTSSRV